MKGNRTTDAIRRTSAASAPVLLMYEGLLFTLLIDRAMTTNVESRAGTMTATRSPGCFPESPILVYKSYTTKELSDIGATTDPVPRVIIEALEQEHASRQAELGVVQHCGVAIA